MSAVQLRKKGLCSLVVEVHFIQSLGIPFEVHFAMYSSCPLDLQHLQLYSMFDRP